MKQIKVRVKCNIKGKEYKKGSIFKPKKGDMLLINKLNEQGYIEPLSEQELLEISNSLNFEKKGGNKNEPNT